MLVGVAHTIVLACAGLYATAPAYRVLASVLRWAGLLALAGAAAATGAALLWVALAGRVPRPGGRRTPRPLHAGWIPPASYAASWAVVLGHSARTQYDDRPLLATLAATLGLAAFVALRLAVRGRRPAGGTLDAVPRRLGMRLTAWLPPLGATLCLIMPRWMPPPVPRVPDELLAPQSSIALQAEAQARFAGERRNLLLITIDTLRADHLGCYGYSRETTPALDALALQGVRMERALCPRPTTSPSFGTFFTGLYPVGHGVHFTLETLAQSNVTLAELLRDEGYATAGVVTNANLYPAFGFGQGFDDYVFGHIRADEGRQRALHWLEQQRPVDRPWFLWFHSTDPHAPYSPLPPYDTMFGSPAPGDPVARQVALYDGEIRFVDDQIAEVLRYLQERPELWQNTLIVFTSDHGESLGEHDYYFQHGELPYESTARVPLLFVAPGVLPAGAVRPELVTGADLLPTLLSALGLTVPAHVQGASYLPSLLGLADRGPHDFVFLEAGFGEHIRLGRTRTLCRAGTKYVQRLTRWARVPDSPVDLVWSMDALLEGGLQPDELYDLTTDPGEQVNLFGRDPARDASERRLLEAFARRLAETPAHDAGPTPRLDATTLEQLRTLGYVE
jgi:arylsulfatase A-like enzyme